MAKYRVYGWAKIGVEMTVEAESAEDAIDKADQEFDGLTDYVGNGRCGGALVGTSDDNVTLDASGDFGFIDAEAAND